MLSIVSITFMVFFFFAFHFYRCGRSKKCYVCVSVPLLFPSIAQNHVLLIVLMCVFISNTDHKSDIPVDKSTEARPMA